MATDLTLYLDDQPGELARVGELLGQAEVHILVDDLASAMVALHPTR